MISPAVVAGSAALIVGYCWIVGEGGGRLRRIAGASPGDMSISDEGTHAVSPRQRLIGSLAVGLIAIVMVPMPGALAGGALAALGSYVVLGRLESRAARRRREALVGQQPEVLDLISAVQEAGSPLRLAAGEVAALAPEPSAAVLREVDARIGVGFSDAEAWQSLARDPIWGATARDLARSARTGEAVVETLQMSAERARAARRDHLNEKARTVAVKSVGPMMVCFLPAFILAGVVPIFAGILSRYTG